MINRREFLGYTATAGAGLVLAPELLRALQSSASLIQKAIPSSGEKLPVIGLSFSNHVSCADHAALKEVLKVFAENGGRVFDTMHGAAQSEEFHTKIANELGIQNKLFWSLRGTPGAGPGGPTQLGPDSVNKHVETQLARVKASKL